jgi:dTDP-3-amino-3,4,6-trideoxy-alpha-D-glucose transaminase
VSITIPQSSPLANYLAHKDEIDAAIRNTLESGSYILGHEVASFEREFADYLGMAHAVGVGSGTDALYLALRACEVGPGDAVLTVSHTAVATVAAIEHCGATAVFVDIDPATFTIGAGQLAETIAKHRDRLKAIVPVHIYGHPARITDVIEIAARNGLRVIEDCAQAHGAMWENRKVGTFGDIAAFSFYPTKNIGAFGDGGAVVTDDDELANRVRLLREYGWEQRYISKIAGLNSRLDELQAAILRVKLRHLDEDNNRRIRLAQLYTRELDDHPSLTLPQTSGGATHVYHQYVIRAKERDSLRDYLRNQGTGTLIHYPVPVHQQTAYAGRLTNHTSLPETEAAAREILSLPLFPELREEELQTVVEQIRNWQP